VAIMGCSLEGESSASAVYTDLPSNTLIEGPLGRIGVTLREENLILSVKDSPANPQYVKIEDIPGWSYSVDLW